MANRRDIAEGITALERSALARLIDWIEAQPPKRPDRQWIQAGARSVNEVLQCQAVRGTSGIDWASDYKRQVEVAAGLSKRELLYAHVRAKKYLDALVPTNPHPFQPAVAVLPVSPIQFESSRDADGAQTIIWRVVDWRSVFRLTLALLCFEHSKDLFRCKRPACRKLTLRQGRATRGRKAEYCGETCAWRHRQSTHRAKPNLN